MVAKPRYVDQLQLRCMRINFALSDLCEIGIRVESGAGCLISLSATNCLTAAFTACAPTLGYPLDCTE